MLNWIPLEGRLLLWRTHWGITKWLLFPSMARIRMEMFSNLYSENLIEWLEAKPMQLWGSFQDSVPRNFQLLHQPTLSHQHSSKLPTKCSYQYWSCKLILTVIFWECWFWDAGFTCDLNSLIYLEKVIGFSLLISFLWGWVSSSYEDGCDEFQAL